MFEDRTKLQALGAKLNAAMLNGTEPKPVIQEVNAAVYAIARREAGVTAGDLADENQECTPRVGHYWTLVSYLLAQVYMEAAGQLTPYEGWNR
jgi:hypothetical protein